MDIEALKKAITPKTKAIVPVHLFGQVANMDAVMEIAKEHKLFVIEDNAQAIGADYTFKNGTKKKAGTIGNVGTTSFFPSKNLGCYGDGGAIFTNDDELAHTLRGIVNHGMYTRYYHDVVGVNSRLDAIQAGVLKAKLPLLDSYCEARRNAARFYNNAFANNSNIITPTTKSCGAICDTCNCHVFHQYTLQITNGKRDELHKHLLDNNIPNAIYYPVALHAQKAYQDERYNESDFPVTNQLIQTVISLPMHTELEKDQLEFITKTILDFVG
jgi:dTDP-4-amino-4,6-dideoxygalactose transaminase